MNLTKRSRLILFVALAIGILIMAVVLGLHMATKALKHQVEVALGPESEVGDLVVGWSVIEAHGLRIRAPAGWPSEDALRAQKVTITPDLSGLFSGKIQVRHITVEQAYLSVLRARDGRLRLLPSLLEKPVRPDADADAGLSVPPVTIGRIKLHKSTLDFFDATVRQPAHRVRLEHLDATVEGLQVPALSGRTSIDLNGMIKGVSHQGRFAINGWMELANKNSEIATRLQGIDLVILQPYLIKAAETGVRRGTLDLQLKSTVHNNRLQAPGMITLTGLELASGNGALNTFMGIPRQAVMASLKNKNDQITIRFSLEGDLNDPAFSLNESFAKRISTAAADTLGISIEGLTRGLGGVTGGLGGIVKKVFGK